MTVTPCFISRLASSSVTLFSLPKVIRGSSCLKANGKPYQINKRLKKTWIAQLKPPKPQPQKKQGLFSRLTDCFISKEDKIIREIQNYNNNLATDLEREEQAEDEEELSFFLEEEEWNS
jgi:hypothetical protein